MYNTISFEDWEKIVSVTLIDSLIIKDLPGELACYEARMGLSQERAHGVFKGKCTSCLSTTLFQM